MHSTLEYFTTLGVFLLTITYHLFCVDCTRLSKRPEDIVVDDIRQRTLDLSSLNHKVVGIMLKTNGRRYYVSSELCPGGIFLTRPVNENCLCYNGIFQVVRHCCEPKSTRIEAEQIEWRMDLKCGISTGDTSIRPIRAILPLTKTYNRHGSVIMSHSLSGKNISNWRKFDMDDVILRNHAEISMLGKGRFEIVNVKPLGRNVAIRFAERNRSLTVCYSGWFTNFPTNLRVHSHNAVGSTGCCFNVTEKNTPGEVKSPCGTGSILTELVDVPSADIDLSQCDQEIPPIEGQHKIQKRSDFESSPFQFRSSLRGSISENSAFVDDVLGDQGLIDLSRLKSDENRDIIITTRIRRDGKDGSESTLKVIIPRKIGVATADEVTQAKAIATFVSIIRNDPTAVVEPPKTYRYELLKKSVDVFLAVIPDEVFPHIMAKTSFDVFYYLYEAIESVAYDAPALHSLAMQYLDKCLNSSKPINFTYVGCPHEIDEVVITPEIKARLESYYKDKPEDLRVKMRELKHIDIQRNKRFIPELFDIYVDINWKIVDFVHSFCFEYFKDEFNAHHFYETELEKLFLYPEVQRRWFAKHPNGLQYVRGIFPTTKLGLRMKQLDKVAAAGHHLSRYNGTYWLYRPKLDPWFSRQRGLRPRFDSLFDDEARNVINRNIMDDALREGDSHLRTSSGRKIADFEKLVFSGERNSLTYPYKIPDKLPPGEIIWDGRAICLHAYHSDEQGYFSDPKKWGVNPSLFDLGQLYPLDLME